MRTPSLDRFLARGFGNAWVTEPGFASLYVRLSARAINGRRYDGVIDLASMTAKRPGSGNLTRLIARLRLAYPTHPIFVENAINPRLPGKLLSLGFVEVEESSPPCFVLGLPE